MNLQSILNRKGSDVFSIQASSSVADAIQSLVQHNCGSLIVFDGDDMVGIITERDILRTCAERDEPLEEIPVTDRMTSALVTAPPKAGMNEVMGLLTRHRIRHLPVVDADGLCGVVSIGDVVKTQYDELTLENHYLKEYLLG